jgi:hypothetical protein
MSEPSLEEMWKVIEEAGNNRKIFEKNNSDIEIIREMYNFLVKEKENYKN